MSSLPETARVESLLARAAHALRGQAAAFQEPWTTAHLEFSQAGQAHSSRAYVMTYDGAPVRLEAPEVAVASLAELRSLQATPDGGAWLSLILSVGADTEQLGVEANWDERPYWNAPMLRMLLPAGQEPPQPSVPEDEQWLQDLRRYPRVTERVPHWMVLAAGGSTSPDPHTGSESTSPPSSASAAATQVIPAEPSPTLTMPAGPTGHAAPNGPGPSPTLATSSLAAGASATGSTATGSTPSGAAPSGAVPSEYAVTDPSVAAFRARLAEVGYPSDAVILPGETSDQPPIEGAMEVRSSGAEVLVGTRDYGELEVLHRAHDQESALAWLWEYLSRPLPPARPVPRSDLEMRFEAYRPSLAAHYDLVQRAGAPQHVTLPPGVALDRIGSIDGVFLYPWGTPTPMRSLPAGSPNARLYQLLTVHPLPVEAEIVRPWFGQPGGSLRFRIATDGVGVRQLLLAGSLLEVTVGA